MMVHLKKGCTKGCTTKKIVIRKTLAAKGFAELTQHSDPTWNNEYSFLNNEEARFCYI